MAAARVTAAIASVTRGSRRSVTGEISRVTKLEAAAPVQVESGGYGGGRERVRVNLSMSRKEWAEFEALRQDTDRWKGLSAFVLELAKAELSRRKQGL